MLGFKRNRNSQSSKDSQRHKKFSFLGVKFSKYDAKKEVEALNTNLFYANLDVALERNKLLQIDFNNLNYNNVVSSTAHWENLKYVFPDMKLHDVRNADIIPDCFFVWGMKYAVTHKDVVNMACFYNRPLFIVEDGFLKSVDTWANKNIFKYSQGMSFCIDDHTMYFDATRPSRLELMLNDTNLNVSEDQKLRAKECIQNIVKNHLTKYNHQPIFSPEIGRKGVKKVLVVDQSYGDMSIAKGLANEKTFQDMLDAAISENPDADIIVKRHPDTIAGKGGYYTAVKEEGNVYPITYPINPISLINYVDKVYVCSSQFGFEALMCGKEVHVFGMPFYAGWGLTVDRQKCARRTQSRTLEELFYISYILYVIYVNPETKKRCEIEDIIRILLNLRDEYFERLNL